MNLGFELSRFKRSDVQIVSYIEKQLDLKLSYCDFSDLDTSPELKDLFFTGSNNKYDILVILPITAENLLLDANHELGKRCRKISAKFLERADKERVVVQLGYNSLSYKISSYLENELIIDLEKLSGVSYILNNDISYNLLGDLKNKLYNNCLADYLINRDSFLINVLGDGATIPSINDDSLSSLVIGDMAMSSKSDGIEQNTMYACDLLGFFGTNKHGISRAYTIWLWGSILRGEKEFESLTPTNMMYGSSNYTAKTLCKFAFTLGSYNIKNFNIAINLVPKYFSKEKKDFRRPMEAGTFEIEPLTRDIIYADGNLSKDRAVKKFIEASQILGLNISNVILQTKYIRGNDSLFDML